MTEQTRSRERLALLRALFPELAAEVDAAYARHGAGDGDGAAFDAWLDAEAEALRAGELAGAPFAALADAGAGERLRRAFDAARRAGRWGGWVPPEPEAFAAAGADLARLGAALAADPALVPVLAPYGLGARAWERAFERAARDGAAGLAAPDRGGPALRLAPEAERAFAALDAVPDAGLPVVAGPGGGPAWTLRLVPGGAAPAVTGLSFAHGPHVSLPEMLALQLARLAEGEPLVDAGTFTWLAGPLAEGRLAARHVYDAGEGAIRINCREVGSQGPHLGARPPVG